MPARSKINRISLVIFVICLLSGALGLFIWNSSEASADPPDIEAAALNLNLITFTVGLSQPIGMANAGPNDTRLFVVEKRGRIKIVQPNGQILVTPFLSITNRVQSTAPEQGLLGLAFHPNYASNGFFYINYTHTAGGVLYSRISRFKVNSSNPNRADHTSEKVLLTVAQPFSNHKAGDIHFGRDGFLYIPFGDGGSGGDPQNVAQNTTSLLGKMLRIDVDAQSGSAPDCKGLGTGGYTIPANNPLVDGAGGKCDEIWAIGLRNPWRFSFDRLTGEMYIGDVGQATWEEINYQWAGAAGGKNYGWRCYEGNHPFNTTGCKPQGFYNFPIFEYTHTNTPHCSVIAGYVYRGSQFPAMYGHFLLTDFCSGHFWDLVRVSGQWQATVYTNLVHPTNRYVAFGEDSQGELYVVAMAAGTIYRLVENTPSITDQLRTTLYLPVIVRLDSP